MPRCRWCATRCGRPTRSPRSSASAISPGSATCCATGRRATSRRCSRTSRSTSASWSSASCRARPPPTRLPISRSGRTERPAAGDGVGRSGGAAQQHGAGRPHDIPRRAARRKPPASCSSLLTPEERAEAVQLLGYPEGSIGRLMTPHYVQRQGGLDRRAGARSHPHARPGQRNAQRHLRRRRQRAADRRHPHSRVPAHRADQHREEPDGPPVRRAEGDRRSGDGGARVPRRGSHGAAGHRYGGRAHRHRHRGRRARRRGAAKRPKTSSGSADPRRSTSLTWTSRSARWCRSARAG